MDMSQAIPLFAIIMFVFAMGFGMTQYSHAITFIIAIGVLAGLQLLVLCTGPKTLRDTGIDKLITGLQRLVYISCSWRDSLISHNKTM